LSNSDLDTPVPFILYLGLPIIAEPTPVAAVIGAVPIPAKPSTNTSFAVYSCPATSLPATSPNIPPAASEANATEPPVTAAPVLPAKPEPNLFIYLLATLLEPFIPTKEVIPSTAPIVSPLAVALVLTLCQASG